MEAATDAASKVKAGIRLSQYIASLPDAPRKMKPAGVGKFRIPCVVHGGDNPTGMSVDDHLGLWHCFTSDCGGGSIIDLVMKRDSLEYGEAIERLAAGANIALPERTSESVSRKRILQALDAVAEAAHSHLLKGRDEDAQAMREYLRERGLKSKRILGEWLIGTIPSDKRDALKFIKKASRDTAALQAAGILSAEDASFVPLRGRLLFPIMNQEGDVIAFSGRMVEDVRHSFTGKYVNSPSSPTYDKSKMPYGAHYVTDRTKKVVIMEGNLDIIGANEVYGDEETVAVAACGTAITQQHVKWILSSAHKDVELFVVADGDTAGDKAVIKSMWMGNLTRNVSCIRLEEEEDPWDVYQEDPDYLVDMLEDDAVPLIQAVVSAQWRSSGRDATFLENWVKDTYHTLSFTEDKGELVRFAAEKVGKSADKYRRDMSLTVSLDSARNRKRGTITNINPVSSPMKVIVGALLKMTPDEREGVLAPLGNWDDDTTRAVEGWMPVQNQMDVDVVKHLSLGLDAPHRPDIEREIVSIIGEDREYDLSNALKAMTRQFLSRIGGSASPFMTSQIRILRRMGSVCSEPSEQAGALGWLTSLAVDFQNELDMHESSDERHALAT